VNVPQTTVLMAVHNDERYIGEATASILGQSERDFEFLIIDDASTDGTIGIINGFADSRIRILANRERIGLTRSLNAGWREARGQYIARMDGDDVSRPTRLEKQASFLKSHPGCGLLGTGYRTIDEHGCPLDEGRIIAADLDLKKALQVTNQFAHSSAMIPRQVIAAVGGYREVFRFAQDYDLFLRIAEKFAVALLPEILLERRLRLDALTVKYKILQDRFAKLARECARQRGKNGSDFIDPGGLEPADNDALSALGLSPSNREKRSLAAEGYFSWAMYFRHHRQGYAHRNGYVVKLLKRSLLANPRVFLAQAGGRLIRLAGRFISPGRKKPHD